MPRPDKVDLRKLSVPVKPATYVSKLLLILGLVIAVGIVGLVVVLNSKVNRAVVVSEPKTVPEVSIQIAQIAPIRLLFVGDIMLDRLVRKKIKTIGAGDYRFPFLKIRDYLNSFDAVIGNLEGPIAGSGKRVGSQYSFRMEAAAIDGLVAANIKAVNLANNHIWDYSSLAFKETLKHLDQAGIKYFGGGLNETEAYSATVLELAGTKIGLLGFSQLLPHLEAKGDRPGIAVLGQTLSRQGLKGQVGKFERAITEARQSVDVLIVSFHWGDEYTAQPNEFQKQWGRRAIDLGADLVVGHHPHVIQSFDKLKAGLAGTEDKYIFYSLGNFIFDQDFSDETMTAGLLEVEIVAKKIKQVNLRQAKLNKNFQVELN